jgi:hypothetical protein
VEYLRSRADAVGGFLKSLTAAWVALLFMGLPAATFAQRPAIPGQLATTPMELLPASFAAEARKPGLAERPISIAEVADQQHDRHMDILWKVSVVAMLAGTTTDAVSSWHKREGNALLASTDGMFGGRGVGIKAGIAAGILLPQIVLRKHKDLRLAFVVGNLAEAGVFTGAAIHNFGLGTRQAENP